MCTGVVQEFRSGTGGQGYRSSLCILFVCTGIVQWDRCGGEIQM
jgi:hypothetical protein